MAIQSADSKVSEEMKDVVSLSSVVHRMTIEKEMRMGWSVIIKVAIK